MPVKSVTKIYTCIIIVFSLFNIFEFIYFLQVTYCHFFFRLCMLFHWKNMNLMQVLTVLICLVFMQMWLFFLNNSPTVTVTSVTFLLSMFSLHRSCRNLSKLETRSSSYQQVDKEVISGSFPDRICKTLYPMLIVNFSYNPTIHKTSNYKTSSVEPGVSAGDEA